MAVTIEQFKKIARIDYNDDNDELQLYLDASVEFIEKYTNYSLSAKTVTLISNGCPIEYYGYPILSVSGTDKIEYGSLSATLYAPSGSTITVNLGDSNNAILKSAVYSLALTMYESKEISEVTLPVDLQCKINQFRRDSFIS